MVDEEREDGKMFWFADCSECGKRHSTATFMDTITFETFKVCRECGYSEKQIIKVDEVKTQELLDKVISLFNEGKYAMALLELGYSESFLANVSVTKMMAQLKREIRRPSKLVVSSFDEKYNQKFDYKTITKKGYGTYSYVETDTQIKYFGRFVDEKHRTYKINNLFDLEENEIIHNLEIKSYEPSSKELRRVV